LEASWRVHRGNVRRETADYEGALADFQRALALWEASASGDRFGTTKHIGHTYRLMGRLDEARAVLEPLVANRPFNPTPRHLWAAMLELASTYEALGDRGRADEQYRTMIDVLEEHRNTLILDTFRSGSFAHSLSAYDPYERYMRFLIAGGGAGGAADALHVAERARARGFLEMVGAVRSSLAATLPGPLLQQQSRIVRKVSDVQRRLRTAALPKTERESLLAELSDLEQQREAFLVKLRVEHPAIAEARYPDVAEPKALQPALRAGESALVFYLGEPASFRWIVTRADITFGRIAGRKAIEAQATRLRQVMRTPGDPAAARAEADRLSALLLEGATFTGRSLLVVPHGVLHYVPFEALPHRGSLLIERHAVSYAPSLNSAVHLRRGGAAPAPFRILAVGNPSVQTPDSVQASSRAGDIDTVGLLGPLPYAGDEIDAIRRTFGGRSDILSGPEARESAFRASDLRRYPVIHFATHGLVNEHRPGRSGLLFTAEAGEDGVLQMSEIYRLGLRADLVVLSACQTALGREVTGEGIVGLTRAFFYAGARSVVATLWNLNDRFAAEFVARFYEELRSGVSSEEALRRTKLAYLNHPQYSHPFYWSSLVLTGDGTRVLYRESRLMTGVLGGAFAIVVVAAIVLYRRRSSRRGRG
jgi:CHAT domain-containing protein